MPDLADRLARLDALQAELDALRPLADEDAARAMQRLRLEWTYHSNAIEGNSLDYGETRALLMHGVTAHGKPLKDHLDIQRHRDVLLYLEEFVRTAEPVTLATLRNLHRMLMGDTYEVKAQTPDGGWITREEQGGTYKQHPNNVVTQTGETHFYTSPEHVPARMTDLLDRFVEMQEQVESGEMHPLVAAATLHHGLVEIHPFADGNGRLARVLMNLLLMRAHYLPAVIRTERRDAYLGALAQADAGDLSAFIELVGEELEESTRLYLRALRNEPDPDAFSRRVAILRREAETQVPKQLDREGLAAFGNGFLRPLFEETQRRVQEIKPLFGYVNEILYAVTDEGKSVFGDHALACFDEGNYVSFRPHWEIKGLKAFPPFSTFVVYEGTVGDRLISMMVLPALKSLAFPDGKTYEREEALRVADIAFNAVLAQIEEAIQQR